LLFFYGIKFSKTKNSNRWKLGLCFIWKGLVNRITTRKDSCGSGSFRFTIYDLGFTTKIVDFVLCEMLSAWQTLRITYVNYFERSVFIHNPTYVTMCLKKTYMTYMFSNLRFTIWDLRPRLWKWVFDLRFEIYDLRPRLWKCFARDAFSMTSLWDCFAEVDYEIPPKFGMTNFAHNLCELFWAKRLYSQSKPDGSDMSCNG